MTFHRGANLRILLANINQPILVTKRGEPIALITAPPEPKRPTSWLGSFREKGQIVGDIVSPASDVTQWEVLEE